MARTGAEAPPAKMGRRASAATPMGSRERASHPTAEMVIEQPPLRGSRPVLLPTSVRSSAQTISPTVTTEAPPRTRPPIENCESRVEEHRAVIVAGAVELPFGEVGGEQRRRVRVDRDVPCFAAFAGQCDDRGVLEPDVPDFQIGGLLDSGGGVVEGG